MVIWKLGFMPANWAAIYCTNPLGAGFIKTRAGTIPHGTSKGSITYDTPAALDLVNTIMVTTDPSKAMLECSFQDLFAHKAHFAGAWNEPPITAGGHFLFFPSP